MGYTHYFRQSRDFTDFEWEIIQRFCNEMFYRKKLIAGPDGTGRPVINDFYISFNGKADRDGIYGSSDSFTIHKSKSDQKPIDTYCKTNRKYYDDFVTAVLSFINTFANDVFDISSDAEPDEWNGGVSLATLYGDRLAYQFSIRPLLIKCFVVPENIVNEYWTRKKQTHA